MQPLETPVALIIFNRPEHTRSVFARIREARPKQLFIISDGARNESEKSLCETTRNVTENIDWDCAVQRNYSDTNMGCDPRVSSGISWVFQHVDRAIILEDDCVPHPDFFPFSQELLEKYKDDERVMHISGNNYHKDRLPSISQSYYFSRIPLIHGWATWRRAWKYFDQTLSVWPHISENHRLASLLKDPAVLAHWEYKFNHYYTGALTNWDGKWVFACLTNNGLCIVPRVNLVTNIGYGEGATHTADSDNEKAGIPTFPLPLPLIHPITIQPSAAMDADTFKYTFGINRAPHQQILSFVRQHFPALFRQIRKIKNG